MFGRKKKEKTGAASGNSWVSQVRESYKITKSQKPLIGVMLLGIFLLAEVIIVAIGAYFGHPVYGAIVGTPFAALIAMYFFSNQAQSAAYASIEGQLGAAASVLMAIRRGYTTTPAVAVNRNQDMVHRAAGKAGVVLVGEGGSSVRQLLQDERRKTERYVPGVPVTEILVGDGEDRVPIRKLQKHLKKLPKKLNTAQLREVRARLRAVGGFSMPIPKGPMPKGIKIPKR
ncbi:MAG: hypothetical protein RLZ57_1073 [Actinomycetota bacterium]